MKAIDILLKSVEMKASDLHIVTGVPPIVKVNGQLSNLDDNMLCRTTRKNLSNT